MFKKSLTRACDFVLDAASGVCNYVERKAPALTVGAGSLLAVGTSFAQVAAIDTSAATDGITAAATAVVAVIAALTTYMVGKWAVIQVKRLFGR